MSVKKTLKKLLLTVVCFYGFVVLIVAIFLNGIEKHKNFVEKIASKIMNNPVKIGAIYSSWEGISPQILIQNLSILDAEENTLGLQSEAITLQLDGASLLRFSVVFEVLLLDRPRVLIDTHSGKYTKVAGFRIGLGTRPNRVEKITQWILQHQSIIVNNGRIDWRQRALATKSYTNIAVNYNNESPKKVLSALFSTQQGRLFLQARSQGDALSSNNGDIDLAIKQLGTSNTIDFDDFSLSVTQGKGMFILKTLSAKKVRDFLILLGLDFPSGWLYQSKLQGSLRDIHFAFTGPLFRIKKWDFSAKVEKIGIKSTNNTPSLANVDANVFFNAKKGEIDFSVKDTLFSWPKWVVKALPIKQVSGVLQWKVNEKKSIEVQLRKGIFSDKNIHLQDLVMQAKLPFEAKKINNAIDVLTLDAIKNLEFQEGEVVKRVGNKRIDWQNVFVSADGEFSITDLGEIDRYFPNTPKVEKLREWWKGSGMTAIINDGNFHYEGILSKGWLTNKSAEFTARANANEFYLDYGYGYNWPKVERSSGVIEISNDNIYISPKEAYWGGLRIKESKLALLELASSEGRHLALEALLSSDLQYVMDFLFEGPFTGDNIAEQKSFTALSAPNGVADAKVVLHLPLGDLAEAKVNGALAVKQGEVKLPSGVPITNIDTTVYFTQDSAWSEPIQGVFSGYPIQGELKTTTPGNIKEKTPPELLLSFAGKVNDRALLPWLGDYVGSWLGGESDFLGQLHFSQNSKTLTVKSDLQGMAILAPKPLFKARSEMRSSQLHLDFSDTNLHLITASVGEDLHIALQANLDKDDFFERSLFSIGAYPANNVMHDGVNIRVEQTHFDVDEWIQAIIDLSDITSSDTGVENSIFLNKMRSVEVDVENSVLLGADMGDIRAKITSADGHAWLGSIEGAHIAGTLQAQPRANPSRYQIDLSQLHLQKDHDENAELTPVDTKLTTENYPEVVIHIDDLTLEERSLGKLTIEGGPTKEGWSADLIELEHDGIRTSGVGLWENTTKNGTVTNLDLRSEISEASHALDDMDMEGYLRKGDGNLLMKLKWIGAPHDFDLSRLNGTVNLQLKNGELAKIEPGSGKILGLFNSNVLLKRLAFGFSDVIAKGLTFTLLSMDGVLSDGELSLRKAYAVTPAAFIRAQGKIHLVKENIDMEFFVAPEISGNVALLSALANPAAGAVVFLAQKIFQEQLRSTSLKRYRAYGRWEDFEVEEFKKGTEPVYSE